MDCLMDNWRKGNTQNFNGHISKSCIKTQKEKKKFTKEGSEPNIVNPSLCEAYPESFHYYLFQGCFLRSLRDLDLRGRLWLVCLETCRIFVLVVVSKLGVSLKWIP